MIFEPGALLVHLGGARGPAFVANQHQTLHFLLLLANLHLKVFDENSFG